MSQSTKKKKKKVFDLLLSQLNVLIFFLSIIISAIMPQHEECNLFLEDFEKSERSLPCELCKLLDGRTCLGVSHKRKDTGKIIIPAHACQFNTAALILFLFISWLTPHHSIALFTLKSLYIFHLISPTRLLLSVK